MGARAMIELLMAQAALSRAGTDGIRKLTEAATATSFDLAELDEGQRAANRRIVEMSGDIARAAASSPMQRLAVAFVDTALAGFVIATVHGEDDRELDWLMVDPAFHGSGVAGRLMAAGMDWLGRDRPIWLSVLRDNRRAIRFYEKCGFSVDPAATTTHAVPHWIMRYAPLADRDVQRDGEQRPAA